MRAGLRSQPFGRRSARRIRAAVIAGSHGQMTPEASSRDRQARTVRSARPVYRIRVRTEGNAAVPSGPAWFARPTSTCSRSKPAHRGRPGPAPGPAPRRSLPRSPGTTRQASGRRAGRGAGRGLICSLIHLRASASISGADRALSTVIDGDDRTATVFPAPEKRKVGGSTPPLTTKTHELRKLIRQDSSPDGSARIGKRTVDTEVKFAQRPPVRVRTGRPGGGAWIVRHSVLQSRYG